MANVGSLWVSLGLNSAAFTSGRKKANKELQSLASSVKSIQGMMAAGLAAIGASATIGAAKAFVQSNMAAISSTADFADRLGITTEALVGLRHAAELGGTSAKELDVGLQRMTRRIASSQDGAGITASLKELGLEARNLAALSPDQQFKAIADGMGRIGNHNDKVRLAFAIFDSGGVGLLNAMNGGAAAIEAAQQEAERLGITFSRIDAEKVGQAEDAMARLGLIAQGVGQTLAIELSPYITAAANQFMEVAQAGGGIGPKVGSAIESVATGIAYVSDYLGLVKAGFKTLQGVATGAFLVMAEMIDWTGKSVVKLLNLMGVDAAWGDFAGAFADNLRDEMNQAFADADKAMGDFIDGASAKKVKAAFAKIKSDATAAGEAVAAAAAAPVEAIDHAAADSVKSIQKVLDGLQNDLDTFGMTSAQKKLFDLEAMGASPEQIAQARELIDSYAKLESAQKKQQDLMAQGKAIFDSTRTPMEQYEEQIGKLSELLESGAIDWDTYGRAVRKAREELEGVKGEKGGRSATLGERFALQARSGQMSAGGQRAMENGGGGKIQVDGVDKTNKLLESIDGSLRRGLPAVLV